MTIREEVERVFNEHPCGHWVSPTFIDDMVAVCGAKSEILKAEADWLKRARENNAGFHSDNPNKKSSEFLAGVACAEGWLRQHVRIAKAEENPDG